MPNYWLLKSEPETYSFENLLKDKKTNWNGVRNFQARNYLRKMTAGDLALIYHSGDERAVVGIAKVTKPAYTDPDPEGGDWVQVDLQPVQPMKTRVPLSEIKATPELKDIPLIKQSRLSCMPITSTHYQTLIKMGGAK